MLRLGTALDVVAGNAVDETWEVVVGVAVTVTVSLAVTVTVVGGGQVSVGFPA